MRDRNKVKAKISLALLYLFSFLILTYSKPAYAGVFNNFHITLTDQIKPEIILQDTSVQRISSPDIPISLQQPNDTTPKKKDSTRISYIDTIDIKFSKDTLSAPVVYHADDSMVYHVPDGKLYLYGKISSIQYMDNELEAPLIEYDQNTNLVKAHLTKDSTGKVVSYATFNQGNFKSVNDTIQFNMLTGKGLTKGTYTQQNEMFVYGERIKKSGEDIFYALNARFTTCNLDTPHFAFVSKHIKFITNKMAFSGPVHPEFEGVPVPVVLPFGIFPLKAGRHSGLLAPSFAANDQMGLSLDGLGYYKILSPYWDVIARGTIYSYGGWHANLNPRYFKRYRYQGSFSFDYNNYKVIDVPANKTMKISWQHSSDNKARPGVTFRAMVSAGSSKYNEQQANRPDLNFNSTMQSSITYSKNWQNKPYSFSVSAKHDQNTLRRLINLNLPDINFDLNTLYPFRRKEPVGTFKWYENLGIALHTNAKSRTFFYDTSGSAMTQVIDNFRWGASHDVPITLSLPSLGPLQISPGISYRENWYQKQDFLQWNPGLRKVDTVSHNGFFAEREMSFSVSMGTRIFGMFGFNPRNKVQAIRHELRPNISMSYKPDMNGKDYYRVQIDTAGNFSNYYSVYQNSIHGAFGMGEFGGMSFSLDNNVTMKVRNKKDTSAEMRKVTLLQSLRMDASYNFLQDSFKLSNINLSANSNLFEKINVTASAMFDPYQNDPLTGRRIDKLIWGKKPVTLGTLTSANIALQTSFRGGDKKSGGEEQRGLAQDPNMLVGPDGMPLDEYQQEAAYIRNNPGEFVDFNIPWSIDIGYSLRYSRQRNFYNEFVKTFSQDVNLNASINLTPKWKLGGTGYYNISNAEIGSVSMYLSREMHCWQMAINISPVGRYRFFSINISPKSGLLRDLKINRTRSFIDL